MRERPSFFSLIPYFYTDTHRSPVSFFKMTAQTRLHNEEDKHKYAPQKVNERHMNTPKKSELSRMVSDGDSGNTHASSTTSLSSLPMHGSNNNSNASRTGKKNLTRITTNASTTAMTMTQTETVPTTVRTKTKRKSKPAESYAKKAGRKMRNLWIIISLPGVILVGVLAKSVWGALLAMFVPFSIAFLQGMHGYLRFRHSFADAPLPKSPIRGAIKCTSKASGATVNNTTFTELEKPLRLLIIGDSLSFGVGQSSSATPLMPEAIAKTLSKEMGGKAVVWTCHGETGAPTGWIIKELEQSIQSGKFQELFQDEKYEEDVEEAKASWHDRLQQENIEDDPKVLEAPFDVAVVLTGLNDVKGAALPFLLDKEDSKLRSEANKRGGGYRDELQLLLQALEKKMKTRLQTIRESVEEATERVRDRVHAAKEQARESMDTILKKSSQPPPFATASTTKDASMTRVESNMSLSISSAASSENSEILTGDYVNPRQESLFPMVVLPGMPIKATPSFDLYPIRWFAVPLVEVMDGHKKDLATQHNDSVLFVEAPKQKHITEYVCQEGKHWENMQDDNVLLKIRDIHPEEEAKLESDMKDFYSSKKSYRSNARKPHYSVFSGDGVHPTDEGYALWGKFIGDAIITEWRRKLKHTHRVSFK